MGNQQSDSLPITTFKHNLTVRLILSSQFSSSLYARAETMKLIIDVNGARVHSYLNLAQFYSHKNKIFHVRLPRNILIEGRIFLT